MAAPIGLTPGNLGAPGQEQFVNAQVKTRNFALEAYIGSLMLFRSEYLGDEALETRNGFDDPTMWHYKECLNKVDMTRRLITDVANTLIDVKVLFPDLDGQQGNVVNQAPGVIGAQGTTTQTQVPVGPATGPSPQTSTPAAAGTTAANMSGTTSASPLAIRPNTKQPSAPLRDLGYALDGSDPNIPLLSQLNIRNPLAKVVLGLIDKSIMDATRCEDRFLTSYITPETSVLLYGSLQSLWVGISQYGGSANRITIVQGTLPGEEPRGPQSAINSAGEAKAATMQAAPTS
jgi:hypothetical protein